MTDTLRCAIVGTGAIAHFHARSIEASTQARLVAVTDLSRPAADRFAAQWGDPAVYDTLDDLLAAEHPDVVHICTPPGAHRDQTVAAFAAGAHVIVEKPPAPSLDELDEMRAAAEGRGQAARRRLPAAHRHRGRARPPAAAGGRVRTSAPRGVPDALVPR